VAWVLFPAFHYIDVNLSVATSTERINHKQSVGRLVFESFVHPFTWSNRSVGDSVTRSFRQLIM
jgi:hypothetical protein